MNTYGNLQSEKPLLSVLIPTRNRQHTAIASVIEAVKVGPASEVEIVVQDCSDDDALQSLLFKHDLLGRVVYRRVGHSVSMTENWNRGMCYVRGEYVIIIGDDDAVLPGIVDIARWASKRGYLAVKAKQYSFYGWPDFPDKLLAGKLCLKPFTGKFKVVKTESLLQRFSKTGDEYSNFPMAYHNLVKRSVLEQIHNKSGRYFDGLSPDIYSAYAIGLAIESFAVVDYPMTIMGASARSNSSRSRIGQGQQHFSEFNDFQFTSIAPSSWQLNASNTDNMVRAFINSDRKDMLQSVDLKRVFARTVVAEPRRVGEHVQKFVSATRYFERNVPLAIFQLVGNIVGKLALNLMRSLRKPSDSSCDQLCSNIESIADAVDIQVKWLIKNFGSSIVPEETSQT